MRRAGQARCLPGPHNARFSARRDDTDYDHRHFVNLAGCAMLLFVALCIGWAIKTIDENARVERCLSAGRHDCIMLEPAPLISVVALSH